MHALMILKFMIHSVNLMQIRQLIRQKVMVSIKSLKIMTKEQNKYHFKHLYLCFQKRIDVASAMESFLVEVRGYLVTYNLKAIQQSTGITHIQIAKIIQHVKKSLWHKIIQLGECLAPEMKIVLKLHMYRQLPDSYSFQPAR